MLTVAAAELLEDFNAIDASLRLDLLLELAEQLPELPARYADHPELLERVEECQSPVYLFVELHDGVVSLFITAPKEAPTTRAFAAILHRCLNAQSTAIVLDFDDDFPNQLGITQLVSPLRMRGIRGMLARIKRQVAERL